MIITDEALNEFAELWEQDHNGEKLTREELISKATNTLRAIKATYQAIPVEKTPRFKNVMIRDIIFKRIINQ